MRRAATLLSARSLMAISHGPGISGVFCGLSPTAATGSRGAQRQQLGSFDPFSTSAHLQGSSTPHSEGEGLASPRSVQDTAGAGPQQPEASQKASAHEEKCEEVVTSRAEEHRHLSHRAPWLRALVLGANDRLVSNASLLMGVGAGSGDIDTLLLSVVAGLVGGALSMGCGEYISVASQRDAERADIAKEMAEQQKGPAAQARELEELACIYVQRGLPPSLATKVVLELTRRDVIRAHARDELGIDVDELANPLQACLVSALSFSAGAALPLLAAASGGGWQAVAGVSTAGLAAFGALGAQLGGANMLKGGARVLFGGWLAMGVTFGVGSLFGAHGHI